MELLNKNLLSEIDKVLTSIYAHGNSTKVTVKNKTRTIAVALKLIQEKERGIYVLDENGVLVLQDGGIENYLENLRLDKDLEKTIKDLTSKRLKNEVKNNLMYVSVGGIIGIVTAILTVILTSVVTPDKTGQQIEQLNKLTIDTHVEQSHLQTDLQQMRSEIISLQNEIDSLKNEKP